ncbi:TetR/AcrR family transcriptional regulator [Actinomadura rugatobispora]|uniref:TetR/AcrR family transcriptional regulator n=1 Tax=Actinomadura rugatobispora TaxID=1994 RepID=A0ABW1A2A8_9ACTN|nr:TetR/AcrR family transcriptional regulator [Actinomadura rugatobispora]
MTDRLAPALRRRHILTTAMKVIAQEGYCGLTLRAFAGHCGMTAPGLLHYFSGMPEILVAALRLRDESDRAELAAMLASTRTLREALDTVVGYNAARPERARFYAVVQAEAIDPEHPAHDFFRERPTELARLLARSDTTAGDEALVRHVLAVLDGLQTHWLLDPDTFSLTDAWTTVADALLGPTAQTPIRS